MDPNNSNSNKYGSFVPPGTGMMPPNTGMRPGSNLKRLSTAQLRTGQVPSTPGMQAALGISMNNEVKVDDRPVTNHGLKGMRTSHGSRWISGFLDWFTFIFLDIFWSLGRKVQDPAYFVGVLRARISSLTNEIEVLSKESQSRERDLNQYGQYERNYEQLLKEVLFFENSFLYLFISHYYIQNCILLFSILTFIKK